MIRTTLGSPDIGLRSKDIHCAFEVDKPVTRVAPMVEKLLIRLQEAMIFSPTL